MALASASTMAPSPAGLECVGFFPKLSAQLAGEPRSGVANQRLPLIQMGRRHDFDCRIPERSVGASVRPVEEWSTVAGIQEPGALAERAGEVSGRVARRDQQVAGFQDGEQVLEVVEIIDLVEVQELHARGVLDVTALVDGIAVL